MKENRQVFLDYQGKRWLKILLSAGIFLGLLVGLIGAGYYAIFFQPQDKLEKLPKQTNYDVVNNISAQQKNSISVQGSGTFADIFEGKDKNYQITRVPNQEKEVVLSFDDGPDPTYTSAVMEILKKEGVSASFFLVGQNVLKYPDLTRQVASEYEIGNHTFSHRGDETIDYSDPKNWTSLNFELNFNQNAIVSTTGLKTNLFRSPYWGAEGGISENTLTFVTFAKDRGYLVSAPTLDSFDYKESSVSSIVKNAITPISAGVQVILFHDGGGDRTKTVAALPEIIRFYKAQGYKFTTLGELANKPTSEKVSPGEKLLSDISVANYRIFTNFPTYLNPLFFAGLLFTLFYSVLLLVLSIVSAWKIRQLKKKLDKNFEPAIAVVVPAFNEEKVIAKTIVSVLSSKYKKFKLFIIDDGSDDQTWEIAKRYEFDERVKVFKKQNGGKYSALNFAIEKIKEPIFVSIDADTQIMPETLSKIVRFFQITKIGAVAGNIKVGNSKNLLGALQSTEYIMNLNLERNAYSLLNSILVVPGALGAWRTRAVKQVGGYTGATLTEDAELTLKILKAGYKIIYDKESVSYTEAPTSLLQLVKQRFRWTLGVFQTLFGQKDLLFKRNSAFLGFMVLPFTIFFQIPVLFITPLMDIFAIYYFLFVASKVVLIYLGIYLLVRFVLSFFALLLGKEKIWYVFLVPIQRFLYQPILYFSVYKAMLSALRGKGFAWKKLDHFGTVVLKNS